MRETELFELLEGTADAAFVVDLAGLVQFWNHSAEELLGVPAAQALGVPCAAIVDGFDSAGARVCGPSCLVRETCQRNARIRSFDLDVKTASGGRKWVNVSIITAHVGSGGKRLVVHLLRDIDARKKLENLTKEVLTHVGRLTGHQAEELIGPTRAPIPAIELTDQERKILQLLSLGRSTAGIARELQISSVTVCNHIQHILRKLGAHSRLEAVMRAAREQLI